ncbi:MAG TPA: hypothetical protein VEA16_18595, partial [Vicinamibacterales bacterium]|nr:hypothetical protein [Vicinamibacterales bacterium]
MPDSPILLVLARTRRRLLARRVALATAIGGTVFAIALIGAPLMAGMDASSALTFAIAGGAAATAAMLLGRPRPSLVDLARAIERQSALDNLLVTAAELEQRPRPVASEIRDQIQRLAAARANTVDVREVAPIVQPVMVAAAVIAGCVMLAFGTRDAEDAAVRAGNAPRTAAAPQGAFEVRVIPPTYSRRAPVSYQNPVQVTVLAGSRVQVPAIERDWVATASEAIEIKDGLRSKFLSVIVVPDQAPSVRIVEPGKDTAFATPAGRLSIAVQSGDDLELAALSLRYTKASGGGENVSFTDGEVPLRIERATDREWRGRADIVLDALGLAEGDILVYRAVARDTNPAASAVESDQYVIEIGKTAEIADA